MSQLNKRTVFSSLVSLVVASLSALSLSDYASTSGPTRISAASSEKPRITILYEERLGILRIYRNKWEAHPV
jgi:hypothetical protein